MIKYASVNSDRWNSRDVLFKAPVFIAGALLLVNFPTAGIYMLSAANRMFDCVIHFQNDTAETIDSFVLRGPGVELDVGSIRAGKNKRRFVQFQGDGVIEFSATQKGNRFQGNASNIIDGTMGGELIVRLNQDGKFSVTDNLFIGAD